MISLSKPVLSLLCLIFSGHCFAQTPQEKKSADAPSAELTFLCVCPPTPSKYKKEADGLYHTVPEDPLGLPPPAIYYKSGAKYLPLSLNINSLTEAQKVVADSKEGIPSSFYIPDPTPAPPEKGAAKERWLSFASIGKSGDKSSQLVCLFKNPGAINWQPPKVLVMDTSPFNFPGDSVMVINLCSGPITVQLGSKGKPVVLHPSSGAVARDVVDKEGLVLLKIARAAGSGHEIVANTGKIIESHRRAVLAVYDANKAYSGKNTEFIFLQMEAGSSGGN